MISINHIYKEMLTQRTRVLLIIIAVAWGTASITGMLAVGEGLRVTFGKAMAGVGKGIVVVNSGQTSTSFQGIGKDISLNINKQDLENFKEVVKHAKAIIGVYSFSANFAYKGKQTYASPRAVTPNYSNIRNIKTQAGGRFINNLDMQDHQRVIVLGNEIAKNLFKPGENPIGKTILLGSWPFKVIGVMQKKLQLFNYETPDAYQAWIPASTYETLTNAQHYSQLIVLPTAAEYIPQIEKTMRTVFANNHHLDPNDKQILHFGDVADIQKKTNSLFFGMQIFLGLIGSITLIVAGVGIANVMFISVNRATREIGIRMALGARSYHILLHYVIEALITTLIGGIVGIILTQGIIFAIKKIPMHSPMLNYMGNPQPVLSMGVLIAVVISLGIIGLLAGFFPAHKAAHIEPAIALRHD